MKNPFVKENNVGLWIAGAVTGLLTAAGAAAWYFIRKGKAEAEHDEHATDYLKPKPGLHKKKTDPHDLHVIAVG